MDHFRVFIFCSEALIKADLEHCCTIFCKALVATPCREPADWYAEQDSKNIISSFRREILLEIRKLTFEIIWSWYWKKTFYFWSFVFLCWDIKYYKISIVILHFANVSIFYQIIFRIRTNNFSRRNLERKSESPIAKLFCSNFLRLKLLVLILKMI